VKNMTRLTLCALALSLAACVPTYTLVASGPVAVAQEGLTVQPSESWNRIPKTPASVQWEESWTRNGPLLDSVAFVAGLPDGQTLVKQRAKQDQQVPQFHASMGPDDLVSMVESYYRIGAGASLFEIRAVTPASFLGGNGIQVDYSYVARDDLPRKGRAVLRVVNDKLYLMKLEGAASHYFDAARPEFERMVASAALKGA